MSATLAAFAALLLGVLTVFGFAPFGVWALPLLTLGGLFLLWRRCATPRSAAGFSQGRCVRSWQFSRASMDA